ncbi:MAG: hypothetical protein ACC707_21410 [Thiohalomonadales bacterium]
MMKIYAILYNHYHLVLHINEAEAQGWDTDTVIEQWYVIIGVKPKVIGGKPIV